MSTSSLAAKLAPVGAAETARAEDFRQRQEALLRDLVRRVAKRVPFYRKKLAEAGVKPEEVRTLADLARLPFTTKEELREEYPLGLMAVPEREVVRIHSSSGTTGKPVIVPYTARDVQVWGEMMARCFRMVGMTAEDRVQITPGYGLWTAGIGFQAGVERLGAMAVPTGPGNTEKQLEMMVDLRTTVLIGTSSYGLLLAEEVARRGLRPQLHLRLGIFGSERWGEKMRRRIEELLGIESFDIYGLTEVYGPGIGIDCPYHQGIHYWADHLLFEIIHPETGEPLPPGEWGELVITTLTKEGMPLLRYRTRDLTRLLPGRCPCGSPYPRIDRISGRTDDMVKVRGVNMYPRQIEDLLRGIPEVSSEYQMIITREEGYRDEVLLRCEAQEGVLESSFARLAEEVRHQFKAHIGLTPVVEVVPCGNLPRSEKKTRRIFDRRGEY